MSAILNSLSAHNFLIFQSILMTLVSKFMVYRALSYKTHLFLGLRSPLMSVHEYGLGTLYEPRHEQTTTVFWVSDQVRQKPG